MHLIYELGYSTGIIVPNNKQNFKLFLRQRVMDAKIFQGKFSRKYRARTSLNHVQTSRKNRDILYFEFFDVKIIL